MREDLQTPYSDKPPLTYDWDRDRHRCINCGGIFTCQCDLDTVLAVMYGGKKRDSTKRKA